MAQQRNDNIPYYEIFSIREYVRKGETKSSWLRIGAGTTLPNPLEDWNRSISTPPKCRPRSNG